MVVPLSSSWIWHVFALKLLSVVMRQHEGSYVTVMRAVHQRILNGQWPWQLGYATTRVMCTVAQHGITSIIRQTAFDGTCKKDHPNLVHLCYYWCPKSDKDGGCGDDDEDQGKRARQIGVVQVRSRLS